VYTPVGRDDRSWQPIVDEKTDSRSVSVRVASSIRDTQVILCGISLDLRTKDLR
jgi:hypothetical protein